MKKFKVNLNHSVMTILLLFTFIILQSNFIFAQNETGTRRINKVASQMTGSWYDSTVSMFQLKFPIIRSIPPLRSDMPLNVVASYVVIDSLCRTIETRIARGMINGWTTMNDTLRNAVQYLYRAVDYDPVIFTQYGGETEINAFDEVDTSVLKPAITFTTSSKDSAFRASNFNNIPYVAGRYKASLPRLKNYIEEKFRNLVNNSLNKMGLYSLLLSDHIFRIKVLSIETTNNKLSGATSKRYRVTAQVLDNIKGKKYQTISPELSLQISDTTPDVIQFQYSSSTYKHLRSYEFKERYYPNPIPDSAFLFDREFKMTTGQEAVIFLTYGNPFLDDKHDYFDLDLEPRASLNALPVINGQVRDVNHIWSNSDLSDYNIWKNKVNILINKILTNSY